MEIATKARRHKGSPNNYERHFCLALILLEINVFFYYLVFKVEINQAILQ